MRRFIRKVISSSSRSFSLTIPKLKIKEWGIKKGDPLLVLDFDKFLKVIPNRDRVLRINKDKIEKIPVGYRKGYDKIIIYGDIDYTKFNFNDVLKNLPGSELSLKENEITIKFSKEEFSRKKVRRIFIILERLLYFLEKSVKNESFVKEEFNSVKNEFIKLFNLCYREMRYDSKIFLFFLYNFFNYIVFSIESDVHKLDLKGIRKVYNIFFEILFKGNFNLKIFKEISMAGNWLFKEISIYLEEFHM
ncbi:MAG: hypothetical protein ACOCRX_06025 [Candidatus Woesearchaeota archaeon]